METLIHADIFFFASTIALVLVTIGLAVALVYIIKILRTVSKVSDKVKDESDEIIADIKNLRGNIKQQGLGLRNVKEVIKMVFGKNRSKKD
ncbi:hypothetical protein H0W32_02920 [Patescibacteria group bacterium]|nr:hypothetical protein [Patescibacteria group bacterium]